jgi:hypothetical protein
VTTIGIIGSGHVGSSLAMAAIAHGYDVVIIAIPITTVSQLPADALAGKVVIATVNYFPQRDGPIAEIDSGAETVPGFIQPPTKSSAPVRTTAGSSSPSNRHQGASVAAVQPYDIYCPTRGVRSAQRSGQRSLRQARPAGLGPATYCSADDWRGERFLDTCVGTHRHRIGDRL